MKEVVLDLSNFQTKATLLNHVRSLKGEYRISIKKERKSRTNLQNRYYFGVVVDLFADWLRENGYGIVGEEQGDPHELTAEDAHAMLRNRFLRESLHDPRTGEIIGEFSKSTSDLTTVEFMDYIDRCAQWLAEFCGIEVPPPDPFYKREQYG